MKVPQSFFKNTFCEFEEVTLQKVAHLIPDFTSSSGSAYYYTPEGVYRVSNHWGKLAHSKWRIIPINPLKINKIQCGFAFWNQFYPDEPLQKTYFIQVDYTHNEVFYRHKNHPDYHPQYILRTAKETQKRIKQIKNILLLNNWYTYYTDVSKEHLQKEIIRLLITTSNTLEQIKKTVYMQLKSRG
jgi:hypothetical protein